MNTHDERNDEDLPLLTDVVATSAPAGWPDETQLIELQSRLTASTFELTERLLHAAFSEMEATLFEHVANRLRQELPDLVERILHEQLQHSRPGVDG